MEFLIPILMFPLGMAVSHILHWLDRWKALSPGKQLAVRDAYRAVIANANVGWFRKQLAKPNAFKTLIQLAEASFDGISITAPDGQERRFFF